MFASYPILKTSDVEVPGWWRSEAGRYPWIPRRYTHTIQYAQKLSQVGKHLWEYGSIPASPEEIGKWERFTDPRLLAKYILANFISACIRRPPNSRPFASLKTADIQLERAPNLTIIRLHAGGLGLEEPQPDKEQLQQSDDKDPGDLDIRLSSELQGDMCLWAWVYPAPCKRVTVLHLPPPSFSILGAAEPNTRSGADGTAGGNCKRVRIRPHSGIREAHVPHRGRYTHHGRYTEAT